MCSEHQPFPGQGCTSHFSRSHTGSICTPAAFRGAGRVRLGADGCSVLPGLDLHKNQDQEPWHPSHPAARSWPRTTIAEVRAGWGQGLSTWGSLPGVGGCGSSRDGAELRAVLSAATPCEHLGRKGDSQQCPCCCQCPPSGCPAQ